LLQTQPVELVLLDLNMPDISGAEVLKRLTSDGIGPNLKTPIVSMSASAPSALGDENVAVSFAGHMKKPVSPENLAKTVDNFLV